MAESTLYSMVDKGEQKQYPSWSDAAPNLFTFLTALNQSQPIIQAKFELVWSRWPRTIFFAKDIRIPGVKVHTVDVNHAGFTVSIPAHVNYENTEVTFNVIADKEGFHYYDLRNMVIQTGHPLVAGDPRATIGNAYNLSPDEDTLEVRLRNCPEDETHHHWILHNFHPTGIGDIELSTESASFVEFELAGTFTHISYDCGKNTTPATAMTPPPEEKKDEEDTDQSDEPYDNPEEEYMADEFEGAEGGDDGGDEGGGDEDEPADNPEEQYMGEDEYNDEQDWYDENAEFEGDEGGDGDESQEPPPEPEEDELDQLLKEIDEGKVDPSEQYQDWDNKDWGDYKDNENPKFTVQEENKKVDTGDTQANIKTTSVTGEPPEGSNVSKEQYQDMSNKYMNGESKSTGELAKDVEKQAETPPKTTVLKQGNNTITLNGMTKEQAIAASQTKLDITKQRMENAKNPTIKRHYQRSYELQQAAHNSLVKAEVVSEERGLKTRDDEPKLQPMTLNQLRQLNTLVKAIKFNRGIESVKKFKVTVDPIEEIRQYKLGISQLTLPARFHMVKTPTNQPRTTNVELEDPESQLDSSSSGLDSSASHLKPDHKRRPIFPLD